MGFLGPEGINRRMAEIQLRMDAAFPREAAGASAMAFQSHLSACGAPEPMDPFNPVGLSGPIGGPVGGATELRTMADDAAARHGVDKNLFAALVDAESSWNPSAKSPAGAKGLCQLMDPTARDLGVTDSYDPAQSLDGGAKYLRQMLDKFGSPDRALAAYNAGPGFVQKHNATQWPLETQNYVRRIMSRYGGGA